MWKFAVVLMCLSGYCSAGPVGQKRNMPIVQVPMTETEPVANEDPNEMMIMSTLSLPSNATSIRADITDGFSCENKTYGYYADVDNDCQIFHVCLPVTYADGKENTFRWSFICPEDTIFSQDYFTCMRPDDMTITCEESYQYYELNRNFGMIDSNADKETSNEAAAATAESSNENEDEPVKPVVEKQEEQIIGQSKPVISPKPSRRKPAVSYTTQRKPVNSYPLRKIPQIPAQSQTSETFANQIAPDADESVKPVGEEGLKPVVNKFSRRPVTSFIKDTAPESAQILPAANENIQSLAAEEIRPVAHKFSRRPVPVMNNSIRDKGQNTNSKPENVIPSRTDLFNQLRKRPSLFNKKPVEQPAEEMPEEQAKVEVPQEQQNFSPLATDMSNSDPETQVADADIEASESSHVLVKPQEANEIPQNVETTSNMVVEPAQLLEAFEEIPAVISEVVRIPSANEEEAPKEQTLTISNEKFDTVAEPQIIEAVQSAEESEVNEDFQQSPETSEGHFADETQTNIKMPTAEEETQNYEEIQAVGESETAQEAQAAEGTSEIPQSLRTSAEDVQSFDETKPMEEPLNLQEAEQLTAAEETQSLQEEEHTAEEEHPGEKAQSVQEDQAAEEMQNIEDQQGAEELHSSEEAQSAQGLQAAGEIHNFDDHQVPKETEIPEESQIAEETQTDEKFQIAEEAATADESLAIEEVPAAEEVPVAAEIAAVEEVAMAEEVSSLDKTETEEETQESKANTEEVENSETNTDVESPTSGEVPALEENEASVQTAEDIVAEDLKPNEEQTQSTEEVKAIQEPIAPAEEILTAEEPKPVLHEVEVSLVPEESEVSELTEENDELQNVPASLDSDNVYEPAVLEHHSEDSEDVAAPQTVEQMESEKPAGAPESMQATEEMSQPQILVQQMYDDMNMDTNKQSHKGFKPVDPVMAHEAEQLIVDFINTLRKNDFTNETPGVQLAHDADETSADQEAESSITAVEDEDEEKPESNERTVEAENQDEISSAIIQNHDDGAEEKHEEMQEVQEMEDSKQDTAPESEAEQDTFALKLLENHNLENTNEHQQSQVSAAEAINLPQEMYQIPVKVITDPVEEIAHTEEQSNESETKSSEIIAKTDEIAHEDESSAVHMAGNKPLSIDDIVELVKERLDQMPKNEMETPMQLEHVLGEAQADEISEQEMPAAPQEDESQNSSQSVEETVMPIYQRIAELTQTDADEPNEASEQNSSADKQPQAPEDVSEIQEKTNRSYKTKLDSRKRRFLFKADSS